MTYRIPSPWKTGLAIPGYVKAEGLRTRAFITKQTPRGTYDYIEDLSTLDPDWAVPQYVKDEGYGQGAKVTWWPPKGFYVGTAVKPGDLKDLPPVFTTFGDKAAKATLRHIRRLPIRERKQQLRKALDIIDPTLWDRTETAALRAEVGGIPANRALQAGLAYAMSTGITAELINTGKTGKPPGPSSLMGLGVCSALGITPQGAGVSPGTGGGAGQVVTPPEPQLQVGPWVLAAVPGGITQWSVAKDANDHRSTNMPADQFAALAQGIADGSVQALLGGGGKPTDGWSKAPAIGVASSGSQPIPGPTRIPAGVLGEAGSWYPIYKFTHPADGKRYGLYVKSVGTASAPAVQLSYRYDPGLLETIWNGLKELVAAIINVVKDVLTEVGDLACGLINTGAASAGATVVGGAAGGPAGAQAGATGVGIAQGMCAGQQPPPAPVSESLFLPLAIAGGVVLTALLVSSSKKKKAP